MLTGAEEPALITGYPCCVQVTSRCVGRRVYGRAYGCRHFKTSDPRSCEHTVQVGGRKYPACMACVPPEAIVEKAMAFLSEEGEKA